MLKDPQGPSLSKMGVGGRRERKTERLREKIREGEESRGGERNGLDEIVTTPQIVTVQSSSENSLRIERNFATPGHFTLL